MPNHTKSAVKGLASIGLVFVMGYAAGGWFHIPPAAHAETRPTPQRQAFLSGSERSEKILREMQTTLEKMDGRLANIERAAAAMSAQGVR